MSNDGNFLSQNSDANLEDIDEFFDIKDRTTWHHKKDQTCDKCGNPIVPDRISSTHLLSEILSILNFDKGFFYTVKVLTINPGEAINHYLNGQRKRLVGPITFLLIATILYSFTERYFQYPQNFIAIFFSGFGSLKYFFEDTGALNQWLMPILEKNLIFSSLLALFLMADYAWRFFYNLGINFIETLVVQSYILGMAILFFTILFPFSNGHIAFLYIGFSVYIVYAGYVFYQMFKPLKKNNAWKGAWSVIAGIGTTNWILGNLDVIFSLIFG